MVDDWLQDRADAARDELKAQLNASAPDLLHVRRRADARRRRFVATAVAVAFVVGGVLVAARPEPEPTLLVGQSPPAATSDRLAPGEAQLLPPSPLVGRSTMASVWTGTEMLLWGGDGKRQFDDGAAYDPRRGSWRVLPASPLTARNAPAAVWTGKEMLLWGGHSKDGGSADGAAFDPAAGTWRQIADAPFLSAGRPVGLWTGTEMLVLAGFNGHVAAAYNPGTDRWRRLPDLPGQLSVPDLAVVWTGSRVVAALGAGPGRSQQGIFAMDPAGNTWTELPSLGEGQVQLAWTGDRLLAVVGHTAVVLAPDAKAWTGLVQLPGSFPVGNLVNVWSGTELLLWSGGGDAFVIDPARRTWRTTPALGRQQREQPAAVWADGVLLVWGGFPDQADGVMLRPNDLPGTKSAAVDLPTMPPSPDRVAVWAGSDGVGGFMDQNGPLVVLNGRTLPVRRVDDQNGNLIGYFGCRFFPRSEVERGDFDPYATCPSGTEAKGPGRAGSP